MDSIVKKDLLEAIAQSGHKESDIKAPYCRFNSTMPKIMK